MYDDPAKIERFAAAVERGSNLDLTLSKAAAQGQQELDGIQAVGATLETDNVGAGAQPAPKRVSAPGLRFSYFVARAIALLLLLLVGRLSIAAISAGGEPARALLNERVHAASQKRGQGRELFRRLSAAVAGDPRRQTL
ncbi:MAG: hypothetical protein ACPHUF_01395 [Gammaproteobacteria bacterium]